MSELVSAADPDHSLSPAVRAAIAEGTPANTRRAYNESCDEYTTWCQESDRTAFPATAETLAAYATYLAYTMNRAPSSVERARWAIIKAHKLAGVTPPLTDGLVLVLKGYRAHLAKTKNPKAKTRKATDLSPDAIRAMFTKIDRTAPAGCRDVALLLTGFVTAGRVSELAALDISDIEFVDGKGMLVDLYRGKTRTGQDLPVKYATDPELCPVRAVRAWMNMMAARGLAAGPLFVRIDQHGHLGTEAGYAGPVASDSTGRMTSQAISQVVGRKALAAALGGRWTGHSVRRGFATAAYGAGADPIDIADGGGWTRGSKVMLGYIQEATQWDRRHPLDGVL